ncbi:metal ABC transporter solute-binding protein, Zn/Mn family, partial [Microbacterium barkeri]|uniref:metal ABC transporter solute-binding protein, Zn/Mn family n=1 Tax=Microbacterium barkeri TaxID=33917 RepID=UPI00360B0F6B
RRPRPLRGGGGGARPPEGERPSHEGHDHIEGFNEHVWYDPHTIAHVVEDLAGELEELLPDAASDIAAAEEALVADIEGRGVAG